MKTDVEVDGDAPAMGVIDYPVSIYYAAVDQCNRASPGAPVEEENDLLIEWFEREREGDARTSSKIMNCSKFNDGLTVCGNREGMTRVAIMFTVRPYFLSLNITR